VEAILQSPSFGTKVSKSEWLDADCDVTAGWGLSRRRHNHYEEPRTAVNKI
jgi:hypothetical protein